MPKYNVSVDEEVRYFITVEADNEEDAAEQAVERVLLQTEDLGVLCQEVREREVAHVSLTIDTAEIDQPVSTRTNTGTLIAALQEIVQKHRPTEEPEEEDYDDTESASLNGGECAAWGITGEIIAALEAFGVKMEGR